MGLFDFFRRDPSVGCEKRDADVRCDDVLLRALVGGGDMDEQKALSVPAFAAAVDFVADTAARLPIKLCRNCREHRRTEEITDDARLSLLNGDCGDLLSAYEARRAQLWDMLLYGAGYMYIEREGGRAAALRYVKRQAVSVTVSPDPIFKDAEIMVNGRRYYPWDFIIAARHTHDGVTGRGLLSQIPELLATTFNEMAYENTIAKTGGNKKGFLQSERKLSQPALDELKKAWREMYSNNGSNMMVLNDGVKYQQAASTSVEMQLNEHKLTNADMIAQSLGLCARVTSGSATTQEYMAAVRTAVLPVVETYRAALDRALLTEAEKRQGLFFVPDTTELLKGDMTSRFGAYATALQNNIMSIDEVRYRENLPPLGFNFMRLGLADVLYDPASGRIITPNTGLMQDTQAAQAKRLPPEHETPEERARHWTKGAHGYFTGSYSDGAGGAGGGSAGGKGLDKSAGSGIIKSGAVSGALDPDSVRAQQHADRYYESVRHMTGDVDKIAKNTGISKEEISEIKDFVFMQKHDLGNGVLEYFAPNYAMAESWQRLIDGKNIQKHDITLLRHEQMERALMRQGFTQEKAHRLTEQRFNYKKESEEYYAKTSKHQNE